MIQVKNSDFSIPKIALGCMRISGMTDADALKLISVSLENEINFFDHADIYGGGKSEEVFCKSC
jgi:predicted oxidoreductase